MDPVLRTVAALYVQPNGCYVGLDSVDPWPEVRDARTYDGPHPVVAHPPCARWGRYWSGGPAWVRNGRPRKKLGDDSGCFAAALAAVRQFGGVLEHPADTHAWVVHGLNHPPRTGGWVAADWSGGITCHVEQGHYGHRARKATWLYACGIEPLSLTWGPALVTSARVDAGFRSEEERRRAVRTGVCQTLSARQRAATPEPFRDVLLAMARTVTWKMDGGFSEETAV